MFEPVRKRWRWLLLALFGLLPRFLYWLLDQFLGDIAVARLRQFLAYLGEPGAVVAVVFSSITAHPIISFVVTATLVVVAIELPAGIAEIKNWWKPDYRRPEDRPFPDVLVQSLERPHMFQIDLERDEWFVVFPRFRFNNREPRKAITLDIQWQPVPNILYHPGRGRAISKPVNQPVQKWEQLQQTGRIPVEAHISFPLVLRPQELRSGYVAFTARGINQQRWFEDEIVFMRGDKELRPSSIQAFDLRTGAERNVAIAGAVRVIFKDDGTVTIGE